MKLNHTLRTQINFLVSLLLISLCKSFTHIHKHTTYKIQESIHKLKLQNSKDNNDIATNRRNFIKKSIIALPSTYLVVNQIPFNNIANADDTEDLTEQLYNPDGSLKDDHNAQVTYDTIKLDIPSNNLQGIYKIPSKWTKDTFVDTSTNTKVCKTIQIFSPPLLANLKKATNVGVAKALQLDSSLLKSDLVSAKKRYIVLESSNGVQEELEVYDFDLAVAPNTCNDSKENLGLGFCPYEDIVLVSAVNFNEKTYVFQLECNREQWRKSNADLKDVRKSFTIVSK